MFDRVTKGSGLQEESIEQRWNRLKGVRKEATQYTEEAAEQQKHHYNLRKGDWKPDVGDLVWCKTHYLSKAAEKFNAKLAPKYDGPWKVTNFVSPVIMTVRYQKTRKTKSIFIGNIKQYKR
uniref:Uncharacterized protein LOC108038700 n=1 Tax=Drosophila rhopaloa TaxID=1041015 RepID=A0A6P4DZ86_DRORH